MFDLTFSRMKNVSFGGEGKGSFNWYERRVEDEDSIEIISIRNDFYRFHILLIFLFLFRIFFIFFFIKRYNVNYEL